MRIMLGFSAVVAMEVIHPPCPRRVPRRVNCSPIVICYTERRHDFAIYFVRLFSESEVYSIFDIIRSGDQRIQRKRSQFENVLRLKVAAVL